MAINSSKRAFLKWQNFNGSDDFLQLSGPNGSILGGIDSTGSPYGNLGGGIRTDSTLSGNGSASSPLSVVGSALISPVVSPNPLAFDTNVAFKGPNPYVDVTRYGVRALNPTTIPVALGLSASINSGFALATISSASSFVNGDGVVIYGAGAAHSMTTPASVVVTPSVAQAGTGTGLVVNAPAGSTTYNYQVIARDKNGGLTAASSVATTSTGAASLGAQSVTISTHTRSGNVTTVVTSSAHGLSVGSMVYIAKTSDDINFGGWFLVSTVADNTHFTFASGLDATNGAPTSATGGNAIWFNANRITWAQVTGAFQYHIYGRTGGSLTWIGCSRPTGNSLTDLTFDDFGSPMMDGFIRPGFVPNTPPGSATSDNLVTTISSGAGTTSLTLSSTAGTSVSGASIRFDNAPNILAAANAARTTNGLLQFPVSPNGQQYPVNSYLVLPSNLTVSFSQGLYLNDTIEAGQGSHWSGDVIPQGTPPPSFGQSGWPVIGVHEANPGIYVPAGTISYWKGLSFLGQGQSNGSLLVFADQVSPITFEDVNFLSTTSSTDYMGVGVILRGDALGSGNSSYVNFFKNVLFTGGPAQVDGVTATPFFYCNGCGLTSLERINLSIRGIFVRPVGAGGAFELSTGRQQGPIMPTVMYFNSVGNSTLTSFVIRQFEQDTGTHAIFANMQGSTVMLHLEGAGYPGTFNGASGPLVTGNPIISIEFTNEQMNGITGQNTQTRSFPTGTAIDGSFHQTVSGAYASQEFNSGIGIGKAYSLFVKGPAPAAPTAAVSAGGSIAVGTHTFQVVPVWPNGAEGALSPPSNAVTTTLGNQTVTVTWAAITPAPKGYNVYQDGQLVSKGGGGDCSTIPQYAGTSAVISSFVCGSSTTVQAGGPTILNETGVFAPALVLSTVLFANLGTPVNGTFYNCADCAVASDPCTGSSTGAFAQRLNGRWRCG